jgi:hypothetical protein
VALSRNDSWSRLHPEIEELFPIFERCAAEKPCRDKVRGAAHHLLDEKARGGEPREMIRQTHGETSGIPLRALLLTSLVTLTLAATSCGAQQDVAPPQSVDSVVVQLDFGGGVMLNSVDYVLTGPGMFKRTGTLNVDAQDTISATFSGLPAGNFDVKVQGTATDDLSFCKGETMFTLASPMNAMVQIALQCSGRASVTADVHVCPTIDNLSVVPSEVYVGSSMQLTLQAHDPDNGPSPLTAAWSATSGNLSNLSVNGATFTCTAPGTFQVGVTVSDGTPAAKCPDTASVTVVCTPPPSAELMTARNTRAGAV